ncbi:hypothetical protein KGO5_01846 [Sinorhizobium sp. KGO-5]|uniref:acetyl-CoA carboxylase biotin carboxyl carrier protein n=1 Tax=Sinorhizobium sp. KGO-5 TaxID=1470810 RepID=UPI00294922DF|nr:hypothetical protein KGO5_01846 [Sinorhizobium sp. KGO-5]
MLKRDRARGAGVIDDFSDPALISMLSEWLEASGARELEIATADGRALKIVLDAAPSPAVSGEKPVAPGVPPAERHAVKAPLPGRFRDRHPSADAVPLSGKGGRLEAGALVGFVEIGPVLLPVRASETAIVAEIHVRAGDLVGYGDTILTTEAAR